MPDAGPFLPATHQRYGENKNRLQDALRRIGDFEMLTQGLEVTRRALDEFGGDQGKGLAISFNGGKDACVVLYLLLFVLAERGELWRLTSSAMKHSKVRMHANERLDEQVSVCLCFTFLVQSSTAPTTWPSRLVAAP